MSYRHLEKLADDTRQIFRLTDAIREGNVPACMEPRDFQRIHVAKIQYDASTLVVLSADFNRDGRQIHKWPVLIEPCQLHVLTVKCPGSSIFSKTQNEPHNGKESPGEKHEHENQCDGNLIFGRTVPECRHRGPTNDVLVSDVYREGHTNKDRNDQQDEGFALESD